MISVRAGNKLIKPAAIIWIVTVFFALPNRDLDQAQAASAPQTGLGIDVDFYTGPISDDVWRQMKEAGQKFAIVQTWGGRSRNEFAFSQLSGARSIGGMLTAAYVLLNYDGKVCSAFAHPSRDAKGNCVGELVRQEKPGGRWQVQQGFAALGSEAANVAFIAIDVEWFLATAPPSDAVSQAHRRRYILDAIDEVRRRHKRPVIYTRNAKRHWLDITGCDIRSSQPGCLTLYKVINDPLKPIPLWDSQDGTPELGSFQPHGEWVERLGRQYKLDKNMFGLPPASTVDLNVFDLSLFSLGSTPAPTKESLRLQSTAKPSRTSRKRGRKANRTDGVAFLTLLAPCFTL